MPFGQLWTIISNFEIFLICQRYKGILTAVFSGGKLDRYVSKIKDGRKVSVSIIHTDPKEAYAGALRRGSESGRFVPIPYMMQACKEYADLNENVEKKFVSIDKIRNLVRAGNEVTEIPKGQHIDINYRITRDELQIIYENYSQLNTLTDEQRKRIEGEAYSKGMDAGETKEERSSLGTSSQGSIRKPKERDLSEKQDGGLRKGLDTGGNSGINSENQELPSDKKQQPVAYGSNNSYSGDIRSLFVQKR